MSDASICGCIRIAGTTAPDLKFTCKKRPDPR